MMKWKEYLGMNPNNLQSHQKFVEVMVDVLVEKVGNFKAHLPWGQIDQRVLILVKAIKTRLKQLGSNWYPDWYCKRFFGELTQDLIVQGHRPHTHAREQGRDHGSRGANRQSQS